MLNDENFSALTNAKSAFQQWYQYVDMVRRQCRTAPHFRQFALLEVGREPRGEDPTMTEIHAGHAPAGPADAREARGPYLHSPLIDFLCLGGGSIPLLVGAVLLLGERHQTAALITASILAVFINNPHFMAS